MALNPDTWQWNQRRREPNKAYPFPCSACGTELQYPLMAASRDGLDRRHAHGAHGLCSVCYQVWRRQGKPDLATFRHSPKQLPKRHAYPIPCVECGRLMIGSRKTPGSGLKHAARGLCTACYAQQYAATRKDNHGRLV